MLTALEQSVVLHEIAKQLDTDGLMTVKDYAEAIGLSRKSYYDYLQRPHVAKAVEDGLTSASKSKDYFALVTRQAALETMRSMSVDEDLRASDRLNALKEIMRQTEFVTDATYQIPYIHLSDSELYELAVSRKERLNLNDDEWLEIRREMERIEKDKTNDTEQ